MGCVIDSLPLCVSVTCTVRWAFLYHVGWNRKKHHCDLSFRILSEGRKHAPQAQKTMPFVQHVVQLWHCTLEYSMFPMLLDSDASLGGWAGSGGEHTQVLGPSDPGTVTGRGDTPHRLGIAHRGEEGGGRFSLSLDTHFDA